MHEPKHGVLMENKPKMEDANTSEYEFCQAQLA